MNDSVGPMIEAAYAKEAATKGYSVSGTATAAMTITKYRQRPTEERAKLGLTAGTDHLYTQTVYGAKTVKASDYSANATYSLENLTTEVGKQAFEQLAR
jgi:hypothetical protein